MKTTSVTVGSATFSSWIPLDTCRLPFNVGFGCTITDGANLTYSVQHTFDDLSNRQYCSISRSTTTATVTLTNHGLSVGDSVIIESSGSSVLDGTYTVASVTNANVFTYTVANSGATSSVVGTTCVVARIFTHADIASETAKGDGNYAFPITGMRLIVSAYTSGKVTLTVAQGG